MKPSFQLNIENPCQERWESFAPTISGGFCGSCQKNVVDFSQMSESELVAFFRDRQNSSERLCGRFRQDQLKKDYSLPTWFIQNSQVQYEIPVALIAQKKYKQSITLPLIQHMKVVRNTAVAVLTLLCVEQGIGQTQVVSGQIVYANDKQALSGVSIVVKGTQRGTISDNDGKYKIEVSDNETLIFSSIGFKPIAKIISIAEGFSKMEMEEDLMALGQVIYISKRKNSVLGGFRRLIWKLKKIHL